MALSQEVKEKLQKRIDELKKRMQYDANDLDYETHLHQVRELQKLINNSKQGWEYPEIAGKVYTERSRSLVYLVVLSSFGAVGLNSLSTKVKYVRIYLPQPFHTYNLEIVTR